MRKKLYSQLWIYFSFFIFFSIFLVLGLSLFFLFLLERFGPLGAEQGNHIFPIIFTLMLSLLIGLGVSIFVGRKILQPIGTLGEAMKLVAKGDFSIQLIEKQKIEDVSHLYDDFNVMVRELRSIESLRYDFVSTVSHEFKTPIATIKGYVQLLQDETLSISERQMYLERMLEGTQQLSYLTDNILRLTKLESQEIGLEQKQFRLDEQIREVILFLQPKWEKQQVELDIDLPRTYFVGNEELLYQVWLNLLDNAIKYSSIGSTIQVKLQEVENNLSILVSDNGIGMSEEDMKRAFDKFYQSDSSRKSIGNGLGLSLVKQIVTLHQGKIEIASELNCGSSFNILLPILHEVKKEKI